MSKFYEITFAWEEQYQGLIMKDPKLRKPGAEYVMDCTLYRYDGKTLTKLGEHRFREEDEIDGVLIDVPEGIKVVE
ncbi:MAG: hypothetical protein WD049_05850 [Candidatus Paceibacterota bacterium]